MLRSTGSSAAGAAAAGALAGAGAALAAAAGGADVLQVEAAVLGDHQPGVEVVQRDLAQRHARALRRLERDVQALQRERLPAQQLIGLGAGGTARVHQHVADAHVAARTDGQPGRAVLQRDVALVAEPRTQQPHAGGLAEVGLQRMHRQRLHLQRAGQRQRLQRRQLAAGVQRRRPRAGRDLALARTGLRGGAGLHVGGDLPAQRRERALTLQRDVLQRDLQPADVELHRQRAGAGRRVLELQVAVAQLQRLQVEAPRRLGGALRRRRRCGR